MKKTSVIDNFFKVATCEGIPMTAFDTTNGFSGVIEFSEDHWIDCEITIDDNVVNDSYIDRKHEYMYDAFVEYVQQQMTDHAKFSGNIIATEKSLWKSW